MGSDSPDSDRFRVYLVRVLPRNPGCLTVSLRCAYGVAASLSPRHSTTMTRKIFRSGNSAVVSIPQESLEALGLEVGAEVEVVVDEEQGRLIVRPAEDLPGVDAEFSRRLSDFIDRYRSALDALADG